MLMQLLRHTPLFVWAILAFLVVRGVLATRERDASLRKLFIIPAVMLILALQDIAMRFGLMGPALAAWGAGVLATALPIWFLGRARIVAGSTAGNLRLRGSWAPLCVMLAVFAIKYTAIVATLLQPQLRQDALFAAALSAASGMSNGYFLGSLARDLKAWAALRDAAPGADQVLA
ncbi:DUF6622 family protein [Massilia sp. 9096]|uniref:DUF6622 family protein n=1 Tax=Massilia sp. 9096 TaxID=1500894 RepID=UPI00055DAE90|nr:DUF6622 family protein [Massilia sp. 9096]